MNGEMFDQHVKDWRLENAVQGAFPAARVDEARFAARVREALDGVVDAGNDADDLAGALLAMPSIETRVDWQRFSNRVSDAVADAAGARRIIRFPRAWKAAIGAVAAAAAIALLVIRTPTAPPADIDAVSYARLAIVHGAAGVAQAAGVARVSIAPADEQPELATADVVAGVEIFLMIDPPGRGAIPRGTDVN